MSKEMATALTGLVLGILIARSEGGLFWFLLLTILAFFAFLVTYRKKS